jgi:hypothetical protein
MHGSFKHMAGVLLLIFVFLFFLLVMGCLVPENRESLLCIPIEPVLSMVASLVGA